MADALLFDANSIEEGVPVPVTGPATVTVSGTMDTALVVLKARYGTDNFEPIDEQKPIKVVGAYAVDMVGDFDIRADLIRVGENTEVTVTVQGS